MFVLCVQAAESPVEVLLCSTDMMSFPRFLRDVLFHIHLRSRGGVGVVAGQRRDVVSVWNSMTTSIMQDQPTDVLCSVGVACIYGVVGVQCMAVTALHSGMCPCAPFPSILL